MKTAAKTMWMLWIMLAMVSMGSAQQNGENRDTKDIRNLSQQFTDPEHISPWMFAPQDNITTVSMTEHPGFMTMWHGDNGQNIRGILKDPIRIDDYPMPWEFHLGMARGGHAPEWNYALGLNLVLTFSDPSTWPQDRTTLPPDTHSFQLLVVHLKGPQIESGPLNSYAPLTNPPDGIRNQHGGDPWVKPGGPLGRTRDVWLLYGRGSSALTGKGDLDPSVMGDWKIPYNWLGYPEASWGDLGSGGPNSHSLNFRARLVSPTLVEVGFYGGLHGEPHLGWRMRNIDVSRFGKITGIWEIGPIVSLDPWLSDDLPLELGISTVPPFKVSHSSQMSYLVDYAVFFGANAENYDHFSDDFDVPGFHAKWYHEAGALTNTYTHPGYLTVTLLPQAAAIWAMTPTFSGQGQIDLSKDKDFPGWEMEVAFIPPDEKIHPWKVYLSGWSVWTESGKSVGYGDPPGGGWMPGVEYDPKEKRHKFISPYRLVGNKINKFDLQWDDPEVPESILGQKKLYMLSQIIDSSHVRIGFKTRKEDPWYLSKPFDVTTVFGEKIGKFDPCRGFWGGVMKTGEIMDLAHRDGTALAHGIGNYPWYPQFLIDYIRFRKGLSTPR